MKNTFEDAIIRTCVVRRDTTDPRPWLIDAPVCALFEHHQIAHCGIMDLQHPTQIVRDHLNGTFFLACLEGSGEVLINGEWQTVTAGQACAQPPFMMNAIRTVRKKSWRISWVRYRERSGTSPVVSTQSPAMGPFNSDAFRAAIIGLHAEAQKFAAPAAMQRWTELIHGYVLSFVQPFRPDDRLERVWQAVTQQLDRDWSLTELAKVAVLSKEHLRRISLQSLGRSPMQQVTYMRIREAADHLARSDEKISVIAGLVGYDNPFAFSDTFQRWVGCRPSDYRKRSRNLS